MNETYLRLKSVKVNVWERVISSGKETTFHTVDFKVKHFNLDFRSLFHGTGIEAFRGKLINIEFLLVLCRGIVVEPESHWVTFLKDSLAY